MGSNERSWPGTERARISSLAEHAASKLQRAEQSCRPSRPPPKAAIFSRYSFLPLTVEAKDSARAEIVLRGGEELWGELSAAGRLPEGGCEDALTRYMLISRSEIDAPTLPCFASCPPLCAAVFVFCREEASAASPSARLFLKDMRSYPARPFPLPGNPNKAGMPRARRRETEGALFLAGAAARWRWAPDQPKEFTIALRCAA